MKLALHGFLRLAITARRETITQQICTRKSLYLLYWCSISMQSIIALSVLVTIKIQCCDCQNDTETMGALTNAYLGYPILQHTERGQRRLTGVHETLLRQVSFRGYRVQKKTCDFYLTNPGEIIRFMLRKKSILLGSSVIMVSCGSPLPPPMIELMLEMHFSSLDKRGPMLTRLMAISQAFLLPFFSATAILPCISYRHWRD